MQDVQVKGHFVHNVYFIVRTYTLIDCPTWTTKAVGNKLKDLSHRYA